MSDRDGGPLFPQPASPWRDRIGPLYAPSHPIYQPVSPGFSLCSLLIAMDSAWTAGYQRGVSDGATHASPRVIEKHITVTKRGDKQVILQRIRDLSAAVDRDLTGKAGMLVDFHQAQQKWFSVLLEDLERL